jgi:hypothetical protein
MLWIPAAVAITGAATAANNNASENLMLLLILAPSSRRCAQYRHFADAAITHSNGR